MLDFFWCVLWLFLLEECWRALLITPNSAAMLQMLPAVWVCKLTALITSSVSQCAPTGAGLQLGADTVWHRAHSHSLIAVQHYYPTSLQIPLRISFSFSSVSSRKPYTKSQYYLQYFYEWCNDLKTWDNCKNGTKYLLLKTNIHFFFFFFFSTWNYYTFFYRQLLCFSVAPDKTIRVFCCLAQPS